MTDPAEAWVRAAQALALLGIDPRGLGGLRLRARAGPVRDRFLAALPHAVAPPPCRRLSLSVSDETLFGGVDAFATLAAGRPVRRAGLIGADPHILILPMAERAGADLAARLARVVEAGHCLVALDEGAGSEASLAPSLAERLGLHIDLDGLSQGDCPEIGGADLRAARDLLPRVRTAGEAVTVLTDLAARLGIASLRAPWLALRAARASAALGGRAEIAEADLTLAAALVLGPRTTSLPPAPTDEPRPPEAPEQDAPGESSSGGAAPDRVLEAVQAALPREVVDRLAAAAIGAARGGGSGSGGARRRGNRRGRPLAARQGPPDGTHRIDVVATLRAAAPWQPLRRHAAPGRFLIVRRDDIRLRRFDEHSDRVLILTVDASGSAAATRLAEVKGACELLLAEAYVRRDHVALIAFRGSAAELMLPPTRSLVHAKRRLAALPGGGGTPLAAGLRAALDLAIAARDRGLSPALAVLTDGRANIGLDGAASRQAAEADAERMARALRARRIPSLLIDTSPRPQRHLAELAAILGGPCAFLPRVDSRRLAETVSAALPGQR